MPTRFTRSYSSAARVIKGVTKGQMFPQLAMIIGSYSEDGTPDAMNAAWATMRSMDEVEIHISSHQSTDNILARHAFTIAPATEAWSVGKALM